MEQSDESERGARVRARALAAAAPGRLRINDTLLPAPANCSMRVDLAARRPLDLAWPRAGARAGHAAAVDDERLVGAAVAWPRNAHLVIDQVLWVVVVGVVVVATTSAASAPAALAIAAPALLDIPHLSHSLARFLEDILFPGLGAFS